MLMVARKPEYLVTLFFCSVCKWTLKQSLHERRSYEVQAERSYTSIVLANKWYNISMLTEHEEKNFLVCSPSQTWSGPFAECIITRQVFWTSVICYWSFGCGRLLHSCRKFTSETTFHILLGRSGSNRCLFRGRCCVWWPLSLCTLHPGIPLFQPLLTMPTTAPWH